MVSGFTPFFHEDPMKLYENIIHCKPKFPASFDPICKDLVKKLLVVDLSKRFGNLKGGVLDIKQHKWFTGVDWLKLLSGEVIPPYIPNIKSAADTSQFDRYPEDFEPYGKPGQDPYQQQFKDF
jgi:serine/threonine protein kinase